MGRKYEAFGILLFFVEKLGNAQTSGGLACYGGMQILSEAQIDRIIEMAWEDRTSFDAIFRQFGLREQEVIALMRRELKPSSWRLWRERAKKVSMKHEAKRAAGMDRFKCSRQRSISFNKISKR
jgi:uncharacterized protein (TIGR03643 family)